MNQNFFTNFAWLIKLEPDMKEIKQILTDRNLDESQFYFAYSLVYEWEDELAKDLKVPMLNNWKWSRNCMLKRIPNLSDLMTHRKLTLQFRLNASEGKLYRWANTKNIIPAIIDYYLTDDLIPTFEDNFKNSPVVLITSKEVYDYLKKKNIKLRMAHWALSISDIYKITPSTQFEKKYNLVLMGRQNPILLSFLKKYAELHPDLTYVYRKTVRDEKGFPTFYYLTSDGKNLGTVNTRKEYIKLMRLSRVGLWAPSGIDTDGSNSHGFNQVTPRFLEYLTAGCHVIARYPKNSDIEYYELDKYWPSINTYQQFEEEMDFFRTHEPDLPFYCQYLEKHYTSTRAKQLNDILAKL